MTRKASRGVKAAGRADSRAGGSLRRRIRSSVLGLAAGLAIGYAAGRGPSWFAARQPTETDSGNAVDLMGEFVPGLQGDFQGSSAIILAASDLLADHPNVLADIVSGLWRDTPIIALVSRREHVNAIRSFLAARRIPADGVRFAVVALDTMWIRDYGPFFVKRADETAVLVDTDYVTSEEEIRDDRSSDDYLPKVLSRAFRLPVVHMPLFLEGGNVLANGDGLCLTSTSFLQRNKERGYEIDALGELLHTHFRAESWIRVKRLRREETGHVDMFVTLTAPNVAVVGACDRARDPENADVLDQAAALLVQVETSHGPMQVHRIPLPLQKDGSWRSYNNVLFGNRRLLVPTYSDVPHSVEASVRRLYRSLLPDRQIAMIRCDSLIGTDGVLRCLSLNVPAFLRLRGDNPFTMSVNGTPPPASTKEETDGIENKGSTRP